jgi:hypothetical protein
LFDVVPALEELEVHDLQEAFYTVSHESQRSVFTIVPPKKGDE